MNNRVRRYCSNCNGIGHGFRHCKNPITSYGVILVDIPYEHKNNFKDYVNSGAFDIPKESGIVCNSDIDIKLFCYYKDKIKFLMICRKHSLGFMEFMRGRYELENVEQIIMLFSQMTEEEIANIKVSSFDELWNGLWNNTNMKYKFKIDYINSKEKFEKLRMCNHYEFMDLDFYVSKVVPTWKHTEWGFPKGRRSDSESDYSCSIREFEEESDMKNDEYSMFGDIGDNFVRIIEDLIGTNGEKYRHVYYLGINETERIPILNPNNKNQINEIGDIKWLSIDDAIRAIRPHHKERKSLLMNIFSAVMNFIIRNQRNIIGNN